MTKATDTNGLLRQIDDCYISIPELTDPLTGQSVKIYMNNLPDLSDRKGASYSNESGIGRSMPFKSYQNSEDRTISWTIHFIVCQKSDVAKIIGQIKALEACVYPRIAVGNTPYAPPPICRLRCGNVLSGRFRGDSKQEICAILKDYSIRYDPNLPWDSQNLIPYKLDMDLSFEVVYDQSRLPGAELIVLNGA